MVIDVIVGQYLTWQNVNDIFVGCINNDQE